MKNNKRENRQPKRGHREKVSVVTVTTGEPPTKPQTTQKQLVEKNNGLYLPKQTGLVLRYSFRDRQTNLAGRWQKQSQENRMLHKDTRY